MKNPERVGRGEDAGGVEGYPGTRDGGEGAEREDIKWADEIRGLKTRRGERAALAEAGLYCAVEVYMLEESEEEVTVLRVGTQQGGSSESESCQEL